MSGLGGASTTPRGGRARRILGGGVAVIGLSFLVLFVPIIVFALVLAVQAGGVPDQSRINAFAAMLSPILMPWAERILTPAVAFRAVRRAATAVSMDGLWIGIVAGILGIGVTLVFGGPLTLGAAISFVILVGLGWFGGLLSAATPHREGRAPRSRGPRQPSGDR